MDRKVFKKITRNNHLTNATWGILDYLAYPLGMLIVAPVALRTLGIAHYGVWAIATAVVSTGSIVASGFGDANIRLVAVGRSVDSASLITAVRSTMGIHLLLGFIVMIATLLLSPIAATKIAVSESGLRGECTWSLFIAAFLILVRALESVCISTQRGFEQYGEAVRFSIIGRIVTLAGAGLLPLAGLGVVSVMAFAALVAVLALWTQIADLKTLLRADSLWPSFDRSTTKALFSFGIFTWVQAVSALMFGQVDRLIAGVFFGAATVASYSLCVQLAQPIYGITAAGLHFLFPYLSACKARGSAVGLRRTILRAFCANVLMVSSGTVALLLFGGPILRTFGGEAVAHIGIPILPLVILSTAVSGLGVTGAYALLALDHVRAVTWINLAGGALMLMLIPFVLPRYGLLGIAFARMAYGPVMLLVYIPLAMTLFSKRASNSAELAPTAQWKEA